MSKLQEIENALQSINDAAFQDYCNLMFYWQGFTFVTSTGSVIGKQKTRKGTPDSYVPLEGDEYAFIEYTTKARLGKSQSFYNKLSDDLDSCFDESKSKLSNDQIKKVILCFTGKLKANEHDKLRSRCAKHNAQFEAYGIDQLSKAAFKYPGLSKELGVPIDTQQILNPSQFVEEYEKGKIATTLSNKLYFRDDDIQVSLEILKTHDVLILSGSPGVGKSRVALEVIKKYCIDNDSFTSACILNKGCPIFDDIRVFLGKNGDYILFIDDANRATEHFKFILQLLNEPRQDNLQIVATVRDYALEEITLASSNFSYNVIKINPLKNQQIKAILESDDFKIRNSTYSDRIVAIAQGNPRLAIMAAKVALEKNDLSAFNEIPKIYEHYFSGVIQQIQKLENVTLLKVLAIVAFFKTIGKDYGRMQQVQNVFGITDVEFWESIIQLHELELVDLYQNDVAKITDQILGMYFFYKVFIEQALLDFGTLLATFGEQHQTSLKDLIYPISNTFGIDHVGKLLEPVLSKVLSDSESQESFVKMIYSLFWIFIPSKVLTHIWHITAELAPVAQPTEYVFIQERDELSSYRSGHEYFEILKDFLRYPTKNYKEALELIFEYVAKKPELLTDLIHFLKTELTYDKRDHATSFYRQQELFKALFRQQKNSKLINGIFRHIATSYLQPVYQKSEGIDRDNSVTIYTYRIPDLPVVDQIRSNIWAELFTSGKLKKGEVIEVVREYTAYHNLWVERALKHKALFWEKDKELLLKNITNLLDTSDYSHCSLAQQYLQELDRLDITYDPQLKKHFTNRTYILAEKLSQDLIYGQNRHEMEDDVGDSLSRTQMEALKLQELAEFVQDFTLDEYLILWMQVEELYETGAHRAQWSYTTSFFQILKYLASTDVKLFVKFIQHVLKEKGFQLYFSNNYALILIRIALDKLGADYRHLFEALTSARSPDSLHWKVSFYHVHGSKSVGTEYSRDLLRALKSIKEDYYFIDMRFINNYVYKPNLFERIHGYVDSEVKRSNKSMISKATYLLLRKVQRKNLQIFFGNSFVAQSIDDLEIDMLKHIYLINSAADRHYDPDGSEMKVLCERDPYFIVEFLEKKYNSKYSTLRGELPLMNLGFIWEMNKPEEILDKLMSFAQSKPLVLMDWEHFANKFFTDAKSPNTNKARDYIKAFIERNLEDVKAIKLIFNVIIYSFADGLLEFLEFFLTRNQNPEIFNELRFYTNGVFSGSAIPRLERRITLMREIDSLIARRPDQSRYVEHRAQVKSEIQRLEAEINREKRREFEGFYSW